MTFGIVATHDALGDPVRVADAAGEYLDDPGRVRDWGFETFHRASDGTGLTDLAVRAGAGALKRAGVSADQVDLVVLAMADIPEYLYWEPAAALQARLGAHHAEAMLVNQACSSGVAAFDVVAGKFSTHPEYRVAVLVTANRVCEQYWNRMDSSTAVTSDGAAAAVLVRGHDEGCWLATEIITDGRFADSAYLAVGGAARPFVAGAEGPSRIGNPVDLMTAFLGNDRRAMIRFVRLNRERNLSVLRRACARAGVLPGSIRHILHMNAGARAMADYAAQCGVAVQDTNAAIARDHGHFGSADQLLAFSRMQSEQRFKPGEVVALTSTGNGMHWACTLLRI